MFPPIPCPHEGTLRGRHGTLARVAMDACCVGACTGRKRGSVRRNRVVLAPRPWRYVGGSSPPATGARKAAHRGEHEGNRKAIARGKPGLFGCTCSSYPRAFFRTRGYGCRRRPAFPAPLCPGNLAECANGRLRTNRPLLELSPLRPKATEPVVERGTAPVSSSTRTVARASSPDRARKGVDDGTK